MLQCVASNKLSERKIHLETNYMVTIPNLDMDLLERFSLLPYLQQTLVHMCQFISPAPDLPSFSCFIRHVELENALKIFVKLTQYHELHKIIKSLLSSSNITIPPELVCLVPFIVTYGCIRVRR